MILSRSTPVRFAGSGARRRPIAAIALATSCVLLACAPDVEADRAAIRALIDKEVAALNGEDLRGLSDVWAQEDDITLLDVPPPGRFEGWDEIARAFRSFFEQTSDIEVTVEDVTIRLAGEVAFATYAWSMVGMVGDRPMIDRGQATAIYRRGEEGWRLVHAHYSPVPPALALEAETEPAAEGETAGEGTDEQG